MPYGIFLKIALHRYFSSLSTYLHPVFLVTLMANRGRVIYGLRDYKEFYKDVFVRAAICEVGPNFSYEPLAGISRKEFRRIGIYSPDEFRAEDQIGGTYNGVKFNLSEAIDIPNDAKLNFGDSAALNLLSAIVFA